MKSIIIIILILIAHSAFSQSGFSQIADTPCSCLKSLYGKLSCSDSAFGLPTTFIIGDSLTTHCGKIILSDIQQIIRYEPVSRGYFIYDSCIMDKIRFTPTKKQ